MLRIIRTTTRNSRQTNNPLAKPTLKVIIARMKVSVLLVLLSAFLAVQQPTLAQAPSLSSIHHVFVIMMENHDWSAITPANAPYMWNTLIPIGSHANNYHNIPTLLHPSEPNYMWLEGGTNVYPDFTFTNDADPSSTVSTNSTQHLATLLNNSGQSWKSYQENMTAGTCPITSVAPYAAKHNPFVFFQDVSGNPPSSTNAYCIAHHSVLTPAILQNDLNTNNVANYNFLTPNLNDDMHDGTVTAGDTWLSTIVPMILSSSLYKQDGAIFITWDEGTAGNNPIGMIILSPFAKTNYSNSINYSHASTVKTMEEIFGLTPLVGHAADTTTVDLSDFFVGNATLDTIGIDRGGTFYLRLHNSTGSADVSAAFNPAAQPFPIVGDWTGAGFDTIGMYDQSTGVFSLRNSITAGMPDEQLVFGNPNDTPLSGRWASTATHSGVGVFRPTNGILYVQNALATGFSDHALVLGNPGDQAVAGDWTGRGYDGLGVFRPGGNAFYLVNQVADGVVFSDINFLYGGSTDLAITGDWIAQGHDGVGIFRPTTGNVYLRNTLTTGNSDNAFVYGVAGDQPIAGHWQVIYPPVAPHNVAPPVLILKTATPQPTSQGNSVPGGNQLGG